MVHDFLKAKDWGLGPRWFRSSAPAAVCGVVVLRFWIRVAAIKIVNFHRIKIFLYGLIDYQLKKL